MLANMMYELMTPNHVRNEDNVPVWVIGDVHGCGDQFELMLQKIRTVSEDALIFQLGDLIDRGPDLLRVFTLTDEYNVRTCLGNHELNFIQEHFNYKYCRSRVRRETHQKLQQLSPVQREYVVSKMLDMKNFYTVEVQGKVWTLSHAPIRTETEYFHDCGAANTYCMSTKAYDKIALNSDCVHGHMHWNYRDIQEQLDDPEQHWYNLDGGACYNGELIALELKSFDTLRVPGAEYAKHETN